MICRVLGDSYYNVLVLNVRFIGLRTRRKLLWVRDTASCVVLSVEKLVVVFSCPENLLGWCLAWRERRAGGWELVWRQVERIGVVVYG